MVACALQKEWYFFILVGLVTFFGGLIVLIPCRLCYYMCVAKSEPEPGARYKKKKWQSFSRIRAMALATLSGQTILSRMLVTRQHSTVYVYTMPNMISVKRHYVMINHYCVAITIKLPLGI